jgi:hypothetical protein
MLAGNRGRCRQKQRCSLDNPIQRAAVYNQIPNHWKCVGPPRLNRDRIPFLPDFVFCDRATFESNPAILRFASDPFSHSNKQRRNIRWIAAKTVAPPIQRL